MTMVVLQIIFRETKAKEYYRSRNTRKRDKADLLAIVFVFE